jgi:hypothetical protein
MRPGAFDGVTKKSSYAGFGDDSVFRRNARPPGGFLGIETEAVEIPGAPDAPFFEFFPTNELNNDSANWSAPNAQALQGLTVAVGLQKFQLSVGPRHLSRFGLFKAKIARARFRYRAVAHAYAPS